MSKNISDGQLIRNEQLLRAKNTTAIDALKKYFRLDRKAKETPIELTCECSDMNCDKHVRTSINTYEKIHKRRDWFTIFKGHNQPSVEKIVAEKDDFHIVEKPILSKK